MSTLAEPLIVVSDVHLEHDGSERSAERLSRLLEQHPGHELALAGDVFNLSADRPSVDPAQSVCRLVAKSPALVASLRRHLAGGGAVTFLAGNHDAGVMARGTRERMLALLELSEPARLSFEPWFIRRAGVHVEHGHAHDPDNAPAHPLSLWSPETEPLGIALTRRFLSPNAAHTFAHAHQTTPLDGLKRAFHAFGARTPLLLLSYFTTSARLTAESAVPERLGAEKARGAAALAAFAERAGLTPELVSQLLEALPRPTHEDFKRTFFRLYFDRVLATASIAAGGARLLLGGPVVGSALALSGALYLRSSMKDGVDRYSNLPVKRLYEGASRVRALTGAKLVVFGHTHCEDAAEGYVNSASFTYTRRSGSPFLRIERDDAAERREIS